MIPTLHPLAFQVSAGNHAGRSRVSFAPAGWASAHEVTTLLSCLGSRAAQVQCACTGRWVPRCGELYSSSGVGGVIAILFPLAIQVSAGNHGPGSSRRASLLPGRGKVWVALPGAWLSVELRGVTAGPCGLSVPRPSFCPVIGGLSVSMRGIALSQDDIARFEVGWP